MRRTEKLVKQELKVKTQKHEIKKLFLSQVNHKQIDKTVGKAK
jgi:cell fate (sporulation/competence/biofilm development) regulator YmcA (YheA/YmcA/DUF963 family)